MITPIVFFTILMGSAHSSYYPMGMMGGGGMNMIGSGGAGLMGGKMGAGIMGVGMEGAGMMGSGIGGVGMMGSGMGQAGMMEAGIGGPRVTGMGSGVGMTGLRTGGMGIGMNNIGMSGIGMGGMGIGDIGMGSNMGLVGMGGGAGIGLGAGMGIGATMGAGGYGGGSMNQGSYNNGDKKLNDLRYEQAHGKHGGMFDGGQSGYSKGEVAAKDTKGDSGYYSGAIGGKNIYEDGKSYHGGQQFNKEGQNEGQVNMMKGHKKGHKIKGYKNSHQKVESGKTEEYFDEANDEGGNYMYNGQAGSFGEKAGSSYKGGKQDGKFNTNEAKNEGQYNNGYLADNANANIGRYGETKYGGTGGIYGFNNGHGVNNMAGHHMYTNIFKKHPFYNLYYK